MKTLQLVIRNQPMGRESTPWLNPYRERFSKAAKEVARDMQGTKLKGADRVREFNRRVGEKLRQELESA